MSIYVYILGSELLGCFIIENDNILFFTNFNYFYNYINNIKISDQDLSKQLNNIKNNIKNIELFLEYLKNSNYNFYNRPLYYEEYNIKINKNNNNMKNIINKIKNFGQFGGSNDYSYKINKYIDKLSILTNNNINTNKNTYNSYNHYLLFKDKYLSLKNLYNNDDDLNN